MIWFGTKAGLELELACLDIEKRKLFDGKFGNGMEKAAAAVIAKFKEELLKRSKAWGSKRVYLN